MVLSRSMGVLTSMAFNENSVPSKGGDCWKVIPAKRVDSLIDDDAYSVVWHGARPRSGGDVLDGRVSGESSQSAHGQAWDGRHDRRIRHSPGTLEELRHFRFAVASYNIHRCIGMDRRRDPERVARVIRELEGQILGLQEVESMTRGLSATPQMETLARASGLTAVAGPAMFREDSEFGNVLLSSFPVVRHRVHDLTVSGREPRGALEAILNIHGREVKVVVTHLGLNADERRYQVTRLVRIAGRDNRCPLILMGDINEWFPPSPALHSLDLHLGKTPALRTFPSRLPVFALDRLWVRPKEAVVAISVHRTPLARVASDHLPVRAELNFTPDAIR